MADVDIKSVDEAIYALKNGDFSEVGVLLEVIVSTLDGKGKIGTLTTLSECRQILDEIEALIDGVISKKEELEKKLNTLADGDTFERRRLVNKKVIYESFQEKIDKFDKKMEEMEEFEIPTTLSVIAQEKLRDCVIVDRSDLTIAMSGVNNALCSDFDWEERLSTLETTNQNCTQVLYRLYDKVAESRTRFTKVIDDCMANYEYFDKTMEELEEYKSKVSQSLRMAMIYLENAKYMWNKYISFKLLE